MARNLKPAYINKIRKLEAPNGYRFDIENYLCNPSIDSNYPAFMKVIEETETEEIIRRVYYFKYCDGSGEYKEEIFTRKKDGGEWQVVKHRTEKTLEVASRYNVKRLLQFCA